MRLRRRLLGNLLAVFVLVLIMSLGMPEESRAMSAPQNPESDWPMLMHDASHTGCTATAATGEVLNFSDNRASYPNSRIPRYKKFELTFDLSKEYPSPYYYYDPQDTPDGDPDRQSPYGVDGVSVDAHFLAPSGRELKVPAFWCQDYQRTRSDNREYLSQVGEPKWKVRFAPSEIGSYQYYITVEDKEGQTRYPSSGSLSFQSTSPDSHGCIRVSERDPRFLEYDDGTSFIPISDGLQYWSVAGGNTLKSYFYDDRFDDFGAHGINLVRVWSQCDGSDPSQPGCWALCVESNDRPGTWINQADAYRLDRIIEAAERNGIAILLSSVGPANYAWSDASGDLDRLLAYWRRNFRYRVARWGYSTAILAWETYNEHGHIAPDSQWWQFYEAYSADQEQTDPYGHLRTTGQGSQLSDSAFWSSSFVDLATYHDYMMERRYPALFDDVVNFVHRFSQCLRGEDTMGSIDNCGLNLAPQGEWSGGQKPWVWAEFGIGTDTWDEPHPQSYSGESGRRATHNRLWAGLFSPLGTAPIEWYWYYQDNDWDWYAQKHDEAHIARRFFDGFDYTGVTFLATDDVNVPNYVGETVRTDHAGLRVLAVRTAGGRGAYAWVQNRDHIWVNADWTPSPVSGTFVLPNIAQDEYRVERWNIMTGEVMVDPEFAVPDANGDLGIAVTGLGRDQAIKIIPTSTPTPTATNTPTPINTPNPTATSTPLPTSTPTFAPPPSPTPIPSPTPAEIIIDNPDARFSTSSSQDAWQEYTYAGGQHYGSSHCYNREMGSSQDTATWSFTVPKPGNYDLYAWWWEGDWRPSDVPYTVHYHNGAMTVRANQQVNGGQWNLLGNFYFQNEGSVIVSDDVSSGQDIVADAIRLVYRSSVEDHTYLPLILKSYVIP